MALGALLLGAGTIGLRAAAQPGEQATVVEVAPGRGEAERAGDVDPHEA